MGENGAGKSTLIKALTGVYPIDGGSITVAGEPRVFGTTADAQGAGISTVYQEVNLCANLSVGENVMLGHEPHARGGIDWKAVHREAAHHLESLGLQIDTRSILSSHSIAIQQLVAISRAMVLDAKVLILDEPTSSLDRGEVEQLFAVIRDLRDAGVAVLFVSHFLDQVYEISDRITVLRNGQLVGEYLVERPAARRPGHQDDRPRARRARSDLANGRPHDRPHHDAGAARAGPRTPRPARARPTSTSTRERSSASPACSDPGAPSSSASSTGRSERMPERSRSSGKPVRVSTPASRDRPAHGVLVRGPAGRGHHLAT